MARAFDERSSAPGGPVEGMADGELWALFQQRGAEARVARQRFLTLLPEVVGRRLHRRRFSSVGECARLVGGVSESVAQAVIALRRRLRPYPEIWGLVERCEVGWSVVARVPVEELRKNPRAWARNLTRLSKREIEVLLRRARGRRVAGAARAMVRGGAARAGGESPSASVGGVVGTLPLPGQVRRGAPGQCDRPSVVRLDLRLSAEERAQLEDVRRDRERAGGERLSVGELLMELVRDAWIRGDAARLRKVPAKEKARVRKEAEVSARRCRGKEPPPKVKRWVRLRAGGRCERAGCRRPGEHIHHLDGRRGPTPHRPERLALLCEGCHGLVHSGCIENPRALPGQWRVRAGSDSTGAPGRADPRYLEERRSRAGPKALAASTGLEESRSCRDSKVSPTRREAC